MIGIVSKSTGSWYKVILNNQEVDARLRGKIRNQELKSTNPVVVGDEVVLSEINDEYFIEEIKERHNCIVRKSNKLSKQYQVIASNIDLALLIITPTSPYTPQGFIDRFLVNAEAYHIPVTIIINKSDIDSKKANKYRDYLLDLYTQIGYPIYSMSFLKAEDIVRIEQIIENKTVLVSGNSGVGKSTLINQLDEDLNQKIGSISTSYNKGMHTTTFAQMFRLGENTRIIDTPGIKDFGIVQLEKNMISHYFPEMKMMLEGCKFNNCMHLEEPGCKIVEALQNEEIHESRYFNYIGILDSL
ncbi:MAG: ribosome small subunit-dependent GTPase A [Bacteroidia bacterium]|nr:ribosome small subunit-dependent GTPase A [Bacteroidia bacterium]